MKIIIPIMGFGHSGGARVLSVLATQWVEMGHTVDFLVHEASKEPYFPTKAGVLWVNNKGEPVRAEDRKPANRFNGFSNMICLYKALSNVGKNYDVILANHSLTAWPVALASCGQARKYYYIQAYEPEYYEHETKWKSRIWGILSYKSYALNLFQICNSPIYIGYKNVRAQEWVPPGLDLRNYFPNSELKTKVIRDPIVLGCIGRSEPFKGTQFVLEAFERLSAQDERFHLHVAFGNLPKDYSHKNLKIIKPANDAELADYYRSLDVMIAPGTVQLGAPHYPVMEAMACGIPVVTTGYMPANSDNAWIVPVADSEAIVTAVLDIVGNPEIAGFKASQGLSEINLFSWTAVSNKMLTIFGGVY